MVLEGESAVDGGAPGDRRDQPVEAAPGSIRGDFATEVTFNLVHGSDSAESAEREIGAVLSGAWLDALTSGSCLPRARRSGEAILEQLGIRVRDPRPATSRS